MQECYHLEVTGPILPSNLHSMMQLLTKTQDDGFSVNMYNHSPTLMFSAVQCKNSVLSMQEKQDKLLNCNLSPELVEHLTKGEDTDDLATIQELRFAVGKYSWVSYTWQTLWTVITPLNLLNIWLWVTAVKQYRNVSYLSYW